MEKITIVLSTDSNYVELLAVSVVSIMENKSEYFFYDIFILHDGLSTSIKNQIINMQNNYSHAQISFIDMEEHFATMFHFNNNSHTYYNKTILYRLAIPHLFKDRQRVIYIDSDTVVLDNLVELHQHSFNNNYILSKGEVVVSENIKSPFITYQNNVYAYSCLYSKILNMPLEYFSYKAKSYINSGVLVFNIPKIIANKKDNELIALVEQYKNVCVFIDQDILVKCFYPYIGTLEDKYNMYVTKIQRYKDITRAEKKAYIASLRTAKILHFVDKKKPNKKRGWHNLVGFTYYGTYLQKSCFALSYKKYLLFKYFAIIRRFITKLSGVSI